MCQSLFEAESIEAVSNDDIKMQRNEIIPISE